MKIGDRLAALDRLQHTTAFKVIASVLLALLTVGAVVTYVVRVNAPTEVTQSSQAVNAPTADGTSTTTASTTAGAAAARQSVQDVLAARTDPTGFAIVALGVGTVSIGAVWLGLGLTYLAILAIGAAVLTPMVLYGPTRGLGTAGVGLGVLVMSFTVLLQLLRLVYSAPGPVFAVARNVLAEAVRMRISLVFIVMVMILLAALPGVLDTSQPLRYRVQAFMSFGTGLSFWVIAILTILFSAATVSFEQRGRVIWQTMTKPVSAWAYVLGKWLGVSGLSAVLLLVCATGIFGFVEYLRGLPAVGESAPFVSADARGAISPDRLVLERQILAARVAKGVSPPLTPDDPSFLEAAREFIENERLSTPDFGSTPEQQKEVFDSLYKSYIGEFSAVAPGRSKTYLFKGLNDARERNLPLVFRHRINVGGNRPDQQFDVAFAFGPLPPIDERLGLGIYHSVQITPCVLLANGGMLRVTDRNYERARELVENGTLQGRVINTEDIVEPDGTLYVQALNGRLAIERSTGQLVVQGNEQTMVFPPDGLEISYSVGGYRGNFFRAMVLLWVKLAFISMLTILASTFLSFPVACLVSFGSFLAGEGSSYLIKSVEVFNWTDEEGNLQVFKWFAALITSAVGNTFKVYDSLNPLDSIVNGKLITWGSALGAIGLLVIITAVMFAVAGYVFSKRELAMYSGK